MLHIKDSFSKAQMLMKLNQPELKDTFNGLSHNSEFCSKLDP